MLEDLVARWGYAAVLVGTLLEGEAVVVLAGAAAHRGLLSLPLVMTCAFVGGCAGDQAWFRLGQRWGPRLLERRPSWAARAARVQPYVDRHGALFVVAFRFIYGLRTVSPALIGATGYPAGRFAVFNALGAAVWAIAFSAVGWGVGAGLQASLGRASRVEEIAACAAAVALATWLAARRWRHPKPKPKSSVPGNPGTSS